MTQTDTQAEQLIPIREVSRLTGVATVTLRAWERRYGLLKPTRTAKGHRLYSSSDVQRVRDIQSWLARGVAVSKVRSILTTTTDPLPASDDSAWNELAAQLTQAVTRLDRVQLEKQLAELMSLYPMPLVADRLLAPLLNNLQQPEYGTASRYALLKTLLLEQLYSGQSRLRQTARGPCVLVVRLAALDDECLPLMLVNSLLINTYRAYYLSDLPAQELIYVAEQLQVDAVVLYGDTGAAMASLQNQVDEWLQLLAVPVLVYGPVVAVADQGHSWVSGKLLSGVGQQSVIDALARELPVGQRAQVGPELSTSP